jgi:hypothetical protein
MREFKDSVTGHTTEPTHTPQLPATTQDMAAQASPRENEHVS